MASVKNLNSTTPAAPAGQGANITFQTGTSTGTDPATGLPVVPVSGYVCAVCLLTSGAPSAAPPTGEGTLAFDPAAHHLYAYGSSGWVLLI